MAPRTILAQLVVALKDDASKGAKALAGNLKDLEKSAVDFAKTMQGAKWGSAFTRDLGKLKATQQEIDSIKKSWGELQGQLAGAKNATMRRNAARQWANDWRNQLQAVRISQQQLTQESIADSKRLAAEQKNAAAQSARDQLKIAKETAREKEKLAREASAAERAAAQETAKAARDAARQQAQAARQAAREARSAQREAVRAEREHGRGAGAIGRSVVRNTGHALGIGAGGYVAGRGARFSILQGAESARESYRQQIAGMTPGERAELSATVDRLSSQYASVNRVQGSEMGRGARNLTGSTSQGLTLLPDLYRARVALQSSAGGDGEGELDKILKATDIAGLQDRPDRFRNFLDSYVKAAQVEGRQISGSDYLSYYRRAKMAGAGLSDEFIATTAPTMMQESGGATAGTMLSTAYQQMIGNRITKKARSAQQGAGLRDKKGQLLDRELFIADPFAWSEKHLVPALQKQGVDINDPVKTSNALSPLFSERNAAEFFAKQVNQRDQVLRNKKLYGGAAGLEAGDSAGKQDPFVAGQGLTGSLANLTAALTGPMMPAAISTLNGLSGGLNALATALANNPAISKIAGLGVVGAAGVVGTGAAVGAIRGALPGGAGLLGGTLTGVGGSLPLLARGAGAAGLAYGAYGVATTGAAVLGGIGNAASGANYTPSDAVGVFELASQLRDINVQIAGIRDRTHPSRAGEPNADLDRLEGQAQEVRNRITSGTQGMGGEIVQTLANGIAEGSTTAAAAMEALMENLRAKARSGITVPINVSPTGSPAGEGTAPARASGGSVAAGSLYRVNEYGEEFFQPTEDGRIIDPRRKAAGGAGAIRTAGPISIAPVINVSGGDSATIVREVLSEIDRAVREGMRASFSDYGVELA